MSLIKQLDITTEQLELFRKLVLAWETQSTGYVSDAVLDHSDDLSWVMKFSGYFAARLGSGEFAGLVRLVDKWTAERTRAATSAVNTCKTLFRFRCPNTRVHINGTYEHLSGDLTLTLAPADRYTATKDEWVTAFTLANDLEGNYFSLNDLRIAFREAGVPDDQII